MAEKQSTSREGLSLQTLVIAAAASGAAAVIVSKFWEDGTVIAAAMTPVIVSIVKELLAKPMESEIVKRPVQQVARVASGSRSAIATRTRSPSRLSGTYTPPPPPDASVNGSSNGAGTELHDDPGEDPMAGPVRTYGTTRRRRRPHLKIALITGLLAFVIAAVVLTVPELIFGGSVGGSENSSTTLFGGKTSDSKDSKERGSDKQRERDSNGAAPDTKSQDDSTRDQQPNSSSDGDTPTTDEPAPTQTEPTTPPSSTTPAPSSPVPPAPPPPQP